MSDASVSSAQPLSVVVLGDSTAFVDEHGPQIPGALHLYPNVMARRLEAALQRPVTVTVVARPGQTVREAAHAVVKDQHLQFDLLGRADAVVVGLGGFDHAPGGGRRPAAAVAGHGTADRAPAGNRGGRSGLSSGRAEA